MIIKPKVRGFICTTAHPKGCYQAVEEQINFIKTKGHFNGPKNVLVIGASTGYGLASRIAATFGAGAKTIGVFFEKAAEGKRTASSGWYNAAAFEKIAHEDGYYAKSINGDAFSKEIKAEVIQLIQKDLKKIDLVIYSLASPRRTHPDTQEQFISALKPIDQTFNGKTLDAFRNEIKEVTIEKASADEINHTVSVMGGEDWAIWMNELLQANVLAEGAKTIAYSYIGPELTHAIYKKGTIGRAKDHLKLTAKELNQLLAPINGSALISVNKAVVTQASAAIPVVPLYIALMFKIMKAKQTHEGCIEQIDRLFNEHLYNNAPFKTDADGLIRLDDLEMDDDVQRQIAKQWPLITQDNFEKMIDAEGYRNDFYKLFGFNFTNVDYETECDPHVEIDSLK